MVINGTSGAWLGVNGTSVLEQDNDFFAQCNSGSCITKVLSLTAGTILSLWNETGRVQTYSKGTYIELIRLK